VASLLLAAMTTAAVVREFGQLSVRPRLASVDASLSDHRPLAARVVAPPRSPPPTTAVRPASPASASASVAPMGQLRDPSALVTLSEPVSAALFKRVMEVRGVAAVELVDTGTVRLAGAPAVSIGVDPSGFRNFTPKASASSDRLWQYVASGTLASSFEMARDRKLTLGDSVPVVGPGATVASSQWLGAFMSVGLPGVDLVVSHAVGGLLNLTPASGLILSAPGIDPFELQTALKKLAPGAGVVLMRPGLALGLSGSSAEAAAGASAPTAAQVSTMLTAATSRLGKPYVWGATGPNEFDCSGLVGWSFAAAGIQMPRTAAEQALTGPAVPLGQIQPGDLLFWAFDPADPGFIDHNAIYLGKGLMIQAPFTGASVQIVPLSTSHLVGAVRVSPAISARMGGAWSR